MPSSFPVRHQAEVTLGCSRHPEFTPKPRSPSGGLPPCLFPPSAQCLFLKADFAQGRSVHLRPPQLASRESTGSPSLLRRHSGESAHAVRGAVGIYQATRNYVFFHICKMKRDHANNSTCNKILLPVTLLISRVEGAHTAFKLPSCEAVWQSVW